MSVAACPKCAANCWLNNILQLALANMTPDITTNWKDPKTWTSGVFIWTHSPSVSWAETAVYIPTEQTVAVCVSLTFTLCSLKKRDGKRDRDTTAWAFADQWSGQHVARSNEWYSSKIMSVSSGKHRKTAFSYLYWLQQQNGVFFYFLPDPKSFIWISRYLILGTDMECIARTPLAARGHPLLLFLNLNASSPAAPTPNICKQSRQWSTQTDVLQGWHTEQ